MTLEEAIKTYTSNAEYERTHGNLQGCLDFRQLAEWLRELKAHREAWEKVKEEITFERDRKLGGEAFEAIQYKCYQNTLDIIDKHLSEVEVSNATGQDPTR